MAAENTRFIVAPRLDEKNASLEEVFPRNNHIDSLEEAQRAHPTGHVERDINLDSVDKALAYTHFGLNCVHACHLEIACDTGQMLFPLAFMLQRGLQLVQPAVRHLLAEAEDANVDVTRRQEAAKWYTPEGYYPNVVMRREGLEYEFREEANDARSLCD